MKKLLLIPLLLITMNVYAKDECTSTEIQKGLIDLQNTTYTLTYHSDKIDLNGDFQEGYFKITVPNLPEGYQLEIPASDGTFVLNRNSNGVSLSGGVYEFQYYSVSCNTPIKSYEVKIPSYKQFCNLDKDCEKNVWFDGTYENLASNHESKEPKVSVTLIVILVLLILIIIGVTFIFIKKRRQKNAVNF